MAERSVLPLLIAAAAAWALRPAAAPGGVAQASSRATEQARLACVRFIDDTCPLPKAHAGAPKKTVEGKPFGDFYFRGAKLMHAFALLGEARQ